VFVRDTQTNTTTRASVDTAGGDPNAPSFVSSTPSISADGRYVAFDSPASDLVPGDSNSVPDVFVRDLQNDSTTRASVDAVGGQANGQSRRPSMSTQGRYMAFDSEASDLVPGDGTSGLPGVDVFVRVVVTPTVDSVTPAAVARGSTATLTVTGSGFLPGAQATAFKSDGVTVNSVTVASETGLQVSVTVDADAPTGARSLVVWNPGTGPGAAAAGFGICGDCLSIT
jgi:hypothetical protein